MCEFILEFLSWYKTKTKIKTKSNKEETVQSEKNKNRINKGEHLLVIPM